MATNYIQPGKTMNFAAPADVASGAGALIGAIFGVALQTLASGARGEFAIEGVWTLAKTSAQAWTEGALIYWDNTNKVCTTTSTSNTRIGVAAAVAANPSSTGQVRLNGVGAPTGA
jgi:predicted RecA/RadA family phage recombinase